MKKLLGMVSILTLTLVFSLPLSADAASGGKGKPAPEPSPAAQSAPAPAVQSAPPVQTPEGGVSVGVGDLRISGIFQALYKVSIVSHDNKNSFDMKRARIFLIGSIVPDKVKYIFQGDAVSSPWLLDARIIYITFLPNTELQVGRFLPNFTYYMPLLVSKLDFIEYPLLTSTFAMWRQVGLQTTTKFSRGSFNFGIFNSSGLANSAESPHYQNTWSDADNWKSFLVRGNLNPSDNIDTSIYMTASRELSDATMDDGQYWTSIKAGGFLRFSGSDLTALLEGMFSQEGRYKGYALLAQAGYKPSDKVEALVRLDAVDKRMIGDARQIRPTVGINYYISGTNAAIYVNYFLDIYETQNSKKPSTIEVQAQAAF